MPADSKIQKYPTQPGCQPRRLLNGRQESDPINGNRIPAGCSPYVNPAIFEPDSGPSAKKKYHSKRHDAGLAAQEDFGDN
jgi:hypothetical protein